MHQGLKTFDQKVEYMLNNEDWNIVQTLLTSLSHKFNTFKWKVQI